MRKFCFLLFALFLCSCSFGQVNSGFPLSLSFFDESIQLPSYRLGGGEFSPGVQISTHKILSAGTTHNIGMSINLGGFYHKKIARTAYLGVDFFYRWTPHDKLRVEPSLGIVATFHQIPQTVYTVENGEPAVLKKSININPMPIAGLKVGYNLRNMDKSPFFLFFQYKWGMELNFFEPIPQLPHAFFAVGIDTALPRKN